MTKKIQGVRYKKWKSPNGRGRYAGRVHLMFYRRESKEWLFVCGKRGGEWGAQGQETDDKAIVTCVGCKKHAPDIVERMDEDVPDLWDLQ